MKKGIGIILVYMALLLGGSHVHAASEYWSIALRAVGQDLGV